MDWAEYRQRELAKQMDVKPVNTTEQKARKKQVRIAKWEGDDRYSWALFVNGRAVYTGMDRGEAGWRRERYIATGEL
jgi:hypothetical protein